MRGKRHHSGIIDHTTGSQEFEEIGKFLLKFHSLEPSDTEQEFVEKAGAFLHSYFRPKASFIAITGAIDSSRFSIHGNSELPPNDHQSLMTLLEGLLASRLDSISTEHFETLPFMRQMRLSTVLSPATEKHRIFLFVAGPEAQNPGDLGFLLQLAEKEIRNQIDVFRSRTASLRQQNYLDSLQESARGMSRLLFKIDDLLHYLCSEAVRTLPANAAAVLVPTDETKTDYRVHAQVGFSSGVVPLKKHLFANVFGDFQSNGNKGVVYSAEQGSYFLLPIIQRGEPEGVLLFFRSQQEASIQKEQFQVAEIFSDWLSVAIESSSIFRRVYEREKEWENTFDSIADPIYLIDNDFRLKKINQSMAVFSMKEIKLPLDRSCYRYLFDQTSVCPWCPVPKGIQTGEPVTIEASIFHGGSWEIQSFPYLDKSNERIGFINVLRDMTLLKRMQEQLIESEKLASAGKLISGVAHEVRNPLFGISATVRALANELKEKHDIQPFLDIITSETTRLNRLMQDLLNYSRPVQIDEDASSISQIATEVLDHLKRTHADRAEDFEILISDLIPLINVDRNKMKQVLFNLIENSIQHSPAGTRIELFVQHMSLANPPEIQIVVKDSGIGINEENLKRVFDPFFTTRPKGTGLGLSIVRKVIHDHGGRISIESHPGVGTTFRISLPLIGSSS